MVTITTQLYFSIATHIYNNHYTAEMTTVNKQTYVSSGACNGTISGHGSPSRHLNVRATLSANDFKQ